MPRNHFRRLMHLRNTMPWTVDPSGEPTDLRTRRLDDPKPIVVREPEPGALTPWQYLPNRDCWRTYQGWRIDIVAVPGGYAGTITAPAGEPYDASPVYSPRWLPLRADLTRRMMRLASGLAEVA